MFENIGFAFGTVFLSSVQAEIYLFPLYATAILDSHFHVLSMFDFTHIHTSHSIRIGLLVLMDPKNMGVAVVISLLSCASAEIYVTTFLEPPSWISDSSGMSVPDNVWVAVVILFLASVELKIYCVL